MIKVLYVEDEQFLGKIVKETLETKGYKVYMVDDGSEVIDTFNRIVPDLCILDVMLPGIDGFSLGKSIRQRNASVPIIYVTAKNQIQDKRAGFSVGGNDYLTKPFSIEELILRMENLLSITNLSEKVESQDLSIGSFIYSPRQMSLTNQNNTVFLSFRENEILRSIAKAMPNPISRKEILMAVWGNDSIYNSRNLDVYIKKIRDYLKPDTAIRLVTLKGFGYKLHVI